MKDKAAQSQRSAKRVYSLFPKPLANGMVSPLSTIFRKRGFDHEAILHYWPIAAGELLASHSLPIRLKQKQSEQHSQLIVKVHPAYSTIMVHETEAILQRLTRYLGYRPAKRIVLVQ